MKKVLYVGPYYFSSSFDSIETISYVFRGLYESIEDVVSKIYILTSKDIPEEVLFEFKKFPKLKIVKATAYRSGIIGALRRHYEIIHKGINLVKKENIDVVTNITGEFVYGFDAAFIGKITGKKVILRVPGNQILSAYYMGRYKKWKKIILIFDLLRRWLAYKWADKIIVMSSLEKERVKSFIREENKLIICPRGIDTKKFNVSFRKKGKYIKVLYIGRKSKEKGYDIVIKAAKLLEDISTIQFEFVGDFGIKENKNIKFRGPVHPSMLPEVYKNIDIVVLPSRNEGLPQVVVEAMSCGKIVILAENIFSKIFPPNIAIFTNNSPQDIAKKIKFLLENPDEIQRVGKAARLFIEKNYSNKFFKKLYRKVINGEI